MESTLADQYYLRAEDLYPCWNEIVLESLNYALSYDEYHAPANCLFGRLYMYQQKDYKRAASCFIKALEGDLNYVETYYHFSLLRIWLGEYKEALALIQHAMKIKGTNHSRVLMNLAMIHESRGELDKAAVVLKRAKLLSLNSDTFEKINECISRLKQKGKLMKSQKKECKNRLSVA